MNIENINATCPICMCNIEKPCSIGCRHLFCKTCIVKWLGLDMLNSHKCPVCRKSYSNQNIEQGQVQCLGEE